MIDCLDHMMVESLSGCVTCRGCPLRSPTSLPLSVCLFVCLCADDWCGWVLVWCRPECVSSLSAGTRQSLCRSSGNLTYSLPPSITHTLCFCVWTDRPIFGGVKGGTVLSWIRFWTLQKSLTPKSRNEIGAGLCSLLSFSLSFSFSHISLYLL